MTKKIASALNRIQRVIICCVILSLYFVASNAQKDIRYMGFEVNFGTKSTKLTSDYKEIDGMDVIVEGGTLGLVVGNQIIKTRVHLSGFYYSMARVRHTVNVFASGVIFNFYPINLIKKSGQALNPYLSSGITYNILKFEGHYTNHDNRINYSRSTAPYIGKIAVPSASAGFGLEWRLPRALDFIHIFAEAQYSHILKSNADEVLRYTQIDHPTSINAGVSFGFLR